MCTYDQFVGILESHGFGEEDIKALKEECEALYNEVSSYIEDAPSFEELSQSYGDVILNLVNGDGIKYTDDDECYCENPTVYLLQSRGEKEDPRWSRSNDYWHHYKYWYSDEKTVWGYSNQYFNDIWFACDTYDWEEVDEWDRKHWEANTDEFGLSEETLKAVDNRVYLEAFKAALQVIKEIMQDEQERESWILEIEKLSAEGLT